MRTSLAGIWASKFKRHIDDADRNKVEVEVVDGKNKAGPSGKEGPRGRMEKVITDYHQY